MGLLSRHRALLIVVDVQEGFRSYETFDQVAAACARLLQGADHGCAGAGQREGPQRSRPYGSGGRIQDEPLVEKSVFSAVHAEGFRLDGRDQAIVCGSRRMSASARPSTTCCTEGSRFMCRRTRSARVTSSTTPGA